MFTTCLKDNFKNTIFTAKRWQKFIYFVNFIEITSGPNHKALTSLPLRDGSLVMNLVAASLISSIKCIIFLKIRNKMWSGKLSSFSLLLIKAYLILLQAQFQTRLSLSFSEILPSLLVSTEIENINNVINFYKYDIFIGSRSVRVNRKSLSKM